MKSSKLNSEDLKKVKALQEKKNRELLERFIIDKTDLKVKNKYSDKELDAENERRKILDTIRNLWDSESIDATILNNPAGYETIFTQEYYQEMFRLNNWEYDGIISEKPWQAGRHTNEIIYYRFSKEVLPFLRLVNPFIIPGIRKYKHHQFLTTGARKELSKFIFQATNLMRKYDDWNSFRIAYCELYNVPYQLKLLL
ncbi:P63C domain-containing protein [Rhodohalobacter sp. 614A]|uniref:P63C domain-containing protein n=1 Tax=Rhodohalobacter sp. 614A TaxID=2908649 RepID=UPI001F2B87D2|nr:P63C domain-containing protein [Rhodohalobacter sp. 614A]